jgi:hypothetical protein
MSLTVIILAWAGIGSLLVLAVRKQVRAYLALRGSLRDLLGVSQALSRSIADLAQGLSGEPSEEETPVEITLSDRSLRQVWRLVVAGPDRDYVYYVDSLYGHLCDAFPSYVGPPEDVHSSRDLARFWEQDEEYCSTGAVAAACGL